MKISLVSSVGGLGAAVFAAALALAAPMTALANGLDSLAAFIQNAKNGRADFTQTVTSPPAADGASRVRKSSGQFDFQRPGQFRFDYRKPFEQIIVADGKTLWYYDVELNQITERQQTQALAQTPAALIASASNLKALEAEFTLAAVPDRDGLQWVKATPKTPGGQLKEVEIGFNGDKLAALEILDAFGQRSVLRFSRVEVNVGLPAGIFQFKVPAGVDVLRQ
ncbi:MAG: outer membrane lipoprotein chaperone LolA [Burkholderiaceae bacterium]|nr:MAG: outer membrane lipoprotein chaperone LolA [Burkholderiaceae bacterium]